MSAEDYEPRPGSPVAEKMERLLRLVAHLHSQSNYSDFLDPYDRALLDEALQEEVCSACDHDRHVCPGCGGGVPHGTVACAECAA